MPYLVPDYLERVYAGVLGKLIGVYLCQPSESRDYLRTVNDNGSISLHMPLVVADDGVLGTFVPVRALEEHGLCPDLTADAVGKTWRNNVIESRTVFWWSGHAVSTERTASHRLARGVPAPLRDAITTNGPTIAEQVGAQAFIDAWALVAPGNPALAAKFAETASSVGHGSESVYAAKLLAAMEAEAFVSKDVNRLLDVGLSFVPADSLVARVTRDVRNWTRIDCDWEKTRQRIEIAYGYDEIPGLCRAITNHALITMALLYAGSNFPEAMYIVNSAGRDTDCNSGNLGCLIAVMHGLASFERCRDWLRALADRAIISSADGGYSINNAAWIAFDLANLGRRLAGEAPLRAPKDGAQFHFTLPGSVQGFRTTHNDISPNTVEVAQAIDDAGHPGLAIRLHKLSDTVDDVEVLTPAFMPQDFAKMSDYGVMASPLLYPGQQVKAFVRAEKANTASVAIRIRLKVYGPDDTLRTVDSPSMTIKPGRQAMHQWTIPTHIDSHPIQQVGLALSAPRGCLNGSVWLDNLGWSGGPHLCLRPLSNSSANLWKQAWVNGAGDFLTDLLPDSFFISQDNGEGIVTYGTRDWANYQVVVPRLVICLGGRAGVVIRVQGLNRYYALVFVKPNRVALVKALDEERTELAAAAFGWEHTTGYRVRLAVTGSSIKASIGGEPILEATDDNYLTGGIGLVVTDGAISANQFDVSQLD
ncbi:hypothetical protein ASPSYDRAFT_165051 [Aspergillus sydowii CBS 593.65]|uniref:ADP-ribosylglycohydrolase n=1 Tax=Aspergillus sydowii CBS 593.65 TaxID=1036612 RepID=A0A1L9SY98_9EURO|nr:uncharacterized protein ASPSYDRAFT_165051 [Aspergillus sydowii CBS 593.65]OJJ52155.1 hypothetical protein ASPSYDRAFT_165051 [Aspergillus sydowii CBS 593.65]